MMLIVVMFYSDDDNDDDDNDYFVFDDDFADESDDDVDEDDVDDMMIKMECAAHVIYVYSIHIYVADNQRLMAENGAIKALIDLLISPNELILRQAAKALANLGVNGNDRIGSIDRYMNGVSFIMLHEAVDSLFDNSRRDIVILHDLLGYRVLYLLK
jgi:hypothetical protein